MRTFLLACLGGLVGFLAGIVVPMYVSAMIDWANGFVAGGSSGTAFSLLPILTAPLGAGLGFIAGWIFGTYR